MPADNQTRNPNLTRWDALKLFGAGATEILSLERVESSVATAVGATQVDVVVVGAGFAGLNAARNLIPAGKKVVLL